MLKGDMDNTQLMITLLPENEKEQLLDTVKMLTKRSFFGGYLHRGLRHLKVIPFREIENFVHGRPMKQNISGAEIIAVLAAICAVMSVVCPFVGTKVPKSE